MDEREAVAVVADADPVAEFCCSPRFAPVLTEAARRVLVRGANRIGKTKHLCWHAAKYALEHPGSRVRFVSPTSQHAQKVAGLYLAEFLAGHLDGRSYYVSGRGWNGGRGANTILLANGSSIELLSNEDHPDAHSGAELNLVVMDEPPKRAILAENIRACMSTDGQLYIGATMVNRPVKYLREMVQGDDPDPADGRTEHATGWVQHVVPFSPDDCPWYSPETVAQWMADVANSPWDYKQRVLAAWEGISGGRLFTQFTGANVSDQAPVGAVKVALSMDHGEVVGHQCALVAGWRGSRVWVMDEHVNETATTPEADAVAYEALLNRNGMRLDSVDLAIGDTNTSGKASEGARVNEDLERAWGRGYRHGRPPFHVQNADKEGGSVAWGQRVVNAACARGDLVVHPRCVHLIEALRHWQGGRKGEDGELSHLADALRYMLVGILGSHQAYSRLRWS